jgi:hypothetical protein
MVQEASLGVGLREIEGTLVGVACIAAAAGAPQDVGAGAMEVAVVVEVETVENGQSGVGSVDLGDGNGSVHLDDG